MGNFKGKCALSSIEDKNSYMISFFQENTEVLEGALCPNEKTLSIYRLVMDGGPGAVKSILAILFVLLASRAVYLL